MIAFERPLLLAALLFIPAYALAGLLGRRRGGGPRPGLGRAGLPLRAGAPLGFRALRLLRGASLILGFLGLALAAAGPLRVTNTTLYLGRGNEIILVLDLSPSMAAEDFSPDRLRAAKRIIVDFLGSRRNERIGLVAFGGESALVCPPTLDYGTVKERLESLEPGMLGEGTAIGAGIATAIAHGGRSGAPERHIVLLTDGEGNAGALAPGAAAALAAERGFSLSVIGVGSRGEVPLSYRDPSTGQVRRGSYLSGFDRGLLESLARRGGGSYFSAEDQIALEGAFASLAERSSSLSRTRSLATKESLAPPLLGLALAALVLARLLGLLAGTELP